MTFGRKKNIEYIILITMLNFTKTFALSIETIQTCCSVRFRECAYQVGLEPLVKHGLMIARIKQYSSFSHDLKKHAIESGVCVFEAVDKNQQI